MTCERHDLEVELQKVGSPSTSALCSSTNKCIQLNKHKMQIVLNKELLYMILTYRLPAGDHSITSISLCQVLVILCFLFDRNFKIYQSKLCSLFKGIVQLVSLDLFNTKFAPER